MVQGLFQGTFLREWVVGRRNKPTEVKSKEFTYEGHLKAAFEHLRICRRAGLPREALAYIAAHVRDPRRAVRGEPWRLQSWMGHKRIDETMIYVHVAENHRREIPEACSRWVPARQIPTAGSSKMLAARGSCADRGPWSVCSRMPKKQADEDLCVKYNP